MGSSDWIGFSWLFKPKQRDPLELLELFLESITEMVQVHSRSDDYNSYLRHTEKLRKNASKALHHLKVFFTPISSTSSVSSAGTDLAKHEMMVIFTNEALNAEALEIICSHLELLDFESRKDAVALFACLIRKKFGSKYPAVEYLCQHPAILDSLILGYEKSETALFYGIMLRDTLAFEAVLETLFESQYVFKLFDYAKLPTFDLASDAIASLKVPFI